jgi:TolB protein
MPSPNIATAVAAVLTAIPVLELPLSLMTVPQRDRLRSATTGPSASVSSDGRFIAFMSYERLTPADDDQRADVYVLDRRTGSATLQSVDTPDVVIDADCSNPRLSGDGRFIAFETAIQRPKDARIGADVLLRDRVGATTRHLSRTPAGGFANGWSADPSIDDVGETVAFTSTATDLVPGEDVNGSLADIYLFRAATGLIRRVSLDTVGVQPRTGANMSPSVSGDGRFVAFASTAALAAPGLAPRLLPAAGDRARPLTHVYVRDTHLNQTTRIRPRGVEPNGASMMPSISRSGEFVAFASDASNLVQGDRNRSTDIFLYDMRSGAIVLVSRTVAGRSANGASAGASVSADGRFVAFHSVASDLTCANRCEPAAEDINLLPDVFVFDRTTAAITRVSMGDEGGWMEESAAPTLDATGRIIAFSSKHPIDAQDIGDDYDLFVRVAPAR